MTEKDISHFHHIDQSINQAKLSEIKALDKSYHHKFWCYKKGFQIFQVIKPDCKFDFRVGLIASGTIASGIMLNPIVLGAISGDGLVLKTFAAIRDYKKKTEMSKFAYTTYEEV